MPTQRARYANQRVAHVSLPPLCGEWNVFSHADREEHRVMCGIFGYVGSQPEAPSRVLAGLKKLEYRGHDSWGIAARQNGVVPARLLVEKHVGKIGQASTSLPAGHVALGH